MSKTCTRLRRWAYIIFFDLTSAILMTLFYRNPLDNKLCNTEVLSATKECTRTFTPRQLKLGGWGAYVDELLAGGFEKESFYIPRIL